jgi:RimJ/RimL family protein N-acetyltransferase
VGFGLPDTGTAEIGYWVDARVRTRGVATTAVRAACRWAFESLVVELIEWRTEVGNVASRRIAEKVGFLIEATLRNRLAQRGTWVDAWVGSMLREEAPAVPYPGSRDHIGALIIVEDSVRI